MPLSDSALNGFAESLADNIACRAIGLDRDSARIVAARPSDHILTGFLTPVRRQEADDADTDEQLAEDLSQDSAYEQTSIGFEWLAPKQCLRAGTTVSVAVTFCVYLRRIPTYQEQSKDLVWHVEGAGVRSPTPKGTSNQNAKYTTLVPVWTRESLPEPLVCTIDLSDVLRTRRARVSLQDPLERSITVGHELAAPRTQQHVPETALQTAEAYESWVRALREQPAPLHWQPMIDMRLAMVPMQPDCVRIALRLINRTPPTQNRSQLEFVDPNLYAVRLEAHIPEAAHQCTIFRELPQSYRYDRNMAGVGINAHVHDEHRGGEVVLTSDAVPRTRLSRLEPRQFTHAHPRFETLARNPLPLLRTILEEMKAYDAQAWSTKLRTLSGIELQDAEQDRESYRREIAEFSRGIELLADTAQFPAVDRAFRLMNEVMAELGQSGRHPFQEWRLFQIVFIVSQLPALAAREYADLQDQEHDRVDLLWFAAGGGKTEAFLGLILWQAFFDRIRGKQLGITAFVRFPLRLLTFQQLQRLGRALGVAELIRARERLGGYRFSLGYFVGSSVTCQRRRGFGSPADSMNQ